MLSRSFSDRSWPSVRSRDPRSREWTKYSRRGECRHRRTEDVQGEEDDDQPGREPIGRHGEEPVDRSRDRHQAEEGSEPTDRLPRAVEDERAERGDERPERDGARLDETAQAPLKEERQEEDHGELAGAVDVVSLRPHEEHEARHAQNLVSEGDQGREPEAERRVGPDPDEREQRDQERREDERRLP
jgi:hypothetical protein